VRTCGHTEQTCEREEEEECPQLRVDPPELVDQERPEFGLFD
jgi:hypothetical protein